MQVTRLTPTLYLGNAKWCAHREKHLNYKTLHITTPGEEMCPEAILVRDDLEHGDLLDDGTGGKVMGWGEYTEDLLPHMVLESIEWYREVRDGGNRALVHCAAGVHRSTTICLALLAVEEMSLWESIPLVIDAMRKYPKPDSPHWEQEDLETVSRVLEGIGVK